MKDCRSLSNNDLDSQLKLKQISPHPPSEPYRVNNEAVVRTRQQRYRHQSSKSRTEDKNHDIQEIRCGVSSSFLKLGSLQSVGRSCKTKISSAPSPRSRTSDYRLSTFNKERGSGLYTFDSIPSFIQDSTNDLLLPIMKRKQQNNNAKSMPSVIVPVTPKLPPIIITKAIIPCLSQTSPVISLISVKRQTLQQMSKERIAELSRRSMQRSDVHTNSDTISNNHEVSSSEYFGNTPINLNKYRSPNDVSDSFEAKMLASLVAERAHTENVINSSSKIPKCLNSNNFSSNLIPRAKESLVGDSYSDDESSAMTNKLGTIPNQQLGIVDQNGMHSEWQKRCNLSQDTYRSIDVTSAITEPCGQSRTTDDRSCSDGDQYILVHYIPDFGCYIEPKTGMFYESNL